MWQGLGVNYKAKQENWASDIEYFKRIGLNIIRPSLSSFPNSSYTAGSEAEVEGSIEWWRQCAQQFLDEGFTVAYGIARVSVSAGNFTATVWDQYRLNVLADAAYNQSIGFAPDFYQIGNEIEGIIDGTTLTQAQLITNLKSLATEVKAIYPLAKKLVYSTYNLNQTNLDLWLAAGLGDLDVLGGNIYAQTTANGQGFIFGDMGKLGILIKTFGADRVILTEFGIDGNSSQYNAAPARNRNYVMRHIYAGIRELGFTTAIAYSYVGYLEEDNDFALKNIDGSFDVQWGILLADGGKSFVATNGEGVSSTRTAVTVDRTAPVAARTERTTPALPVYFNAKGNLQDNRITPVDLEALRLGLTGDFTVLAKVKPRQKTAPGNTSNHTLCRLDFSFGNNKGYLIQMNATNGSFRVWSGSTAQDSGTGLFTYGTTQWVGVTISGTTAKFYVNGVQVGTDLSILRVDHNATSNMWFLTESGGASASVNGFFGEVYEVISKKALITPAEMLAAIDGTYPTVDIRYKLTRGAGRWTADLSGNNNHGLLSIESAWYDVR